MTYDRSTKSLTDRRLLGCAGIYDKVPFPIPDLHNNPAITVDSNKFLHVVLGTHHDNFLYMKSSAANDSSAWSDPVVLGEGKRPAEDRSIVSRSANEGSYTYVGLLCDANDKLQIVARWAGLGYRFRMIHMRKSAHSANDAWDTFSDSYAQSTFPKEYPTAFSATSKYKHQHLVVPSLTGYVVYRHKLTTDRFGRLYVAYENHAKQFSAEQAVEYCKVWPTECSGPSLSLSPPSQDATECAKPGTVCNYYNSSKAHDPALMRSNDGGTTWYLIDTKQLKETILQ